MKLACPFLKVAKLVLFFCFRLFLRFFLGGRKENIPMFYILSKRALNLYLRHKCFLFRGQLDDNNKENL